MIWESWLNSSLDVKYFVSTLQCDSMEEAVRTDVILLQNLRLETEKSYSLSGEREDFQEEQSRGINSASSNEHCPK